MLISRFIRRRLLSTPPVVLSQRRSVAKACSNITTSQYPLMATVTNFPVCRGRATNGVDAATTPTFYMRELPRSLLVGYETKEGKELFKQALLEGGLEAFFPLNCGIGTLCMILNAFKVDPAVTWKKPWRWFTQEMLDCCQPLQHVKEHGITLAEFSCLAKCNGLEATTKYADQMFYTPFLDSSFEEFEQAVIDSTSSSEQFLAVSYSRATLGQTGVGHFSPVGGYCKKNGGMVLILDVARFKYPSYWVPIKILYESLIPLDPATKQPRGYSILRKSAFPSSELGSLFRLNANKLTWRALFRPLCAAAQTATSVSTLTTTIITSLPTPPVVSRVQEIIKHTHSSPTSASTAALKIPDGVDAKAEYQDFLASFLNTVEEKCPLYKDVDVSEGRLEMTVFLLALFGMEVFLGRLGAEVRGQVEEVLGRGMGDAEVKREVRAVRRQMVSLDGCCEDECCRAVGGC
ncbi:hypothetical protein RUND412_006692 [Rhizina undulata]